MPKIGNFANFISEIEDFVYNKLMPAEQMVRQANIIPAAIIEQMKEIGLFGLTIPQEYGGYGLTMAQETQVVAKLGLTSPAFHALTGANSGIGAQGIVLFGNPQQKQAYLPKLARGDMIAAFAITEEQAGSDIRNIQTTARKIPGGWLLNGRKRYISNAPQAGIFTIITKVDNPTEPDKPLLTAFLVEASNPGISVSAPYPKMGHEGADVAEVVLNDCLVPEAAMLGKLGFGLKIALQVLDRGRIRIAALSTGIARRLLKDSIDYATKRKQFGKPIAEFQLIQAMLADSETECYAAECMVKETATLFDRHENCSAKASCCKLFATEMVGRVADRAVQIHGGAGYLAELAIERFYRDVRLFRIYEGSSQIQQLIIAKHLLASQQTE